MRPSPARPCCGTLFSRVGCAPARARYAAARLIAPAREAQGSRTSRWNRASGLRPHARAQAQRARLPSVCQRPRKPPARQPPGRAGSPRALCHGVSWPPCGEPIAIRRFGNDGANPPGISGIASSAWIPPFAPCSRHSPAAGPAVLRNPVFARIACAPARARYAAARLIAPAPARARARRSAHGSRWPRKPPARQPPGRAGSPRALCHGVSCSVMASMREPIAIRQFGNGGIVPPGFPGIASSA